MTRVWVWRDLATDKTYRVDESDYLSARSRLRGLHPNFNFDDLTQFRLEAHTKEIPHVRNHSIDLL